MPTHSQSYSEKSSTGSAQTFFRKAQITESDTGSFFNHSPSPDTAFFQAKCTNCQSEETRIDRLVNKEGVPEEESLNEELLQAKSENENTTEPLAAHTGYDTVHAKSQSTVEQTIDSQTIQHISNPAIQRMPKTEQDESLAEEEEEQNAVQAKLTIGQTDDPYEQEADAVADRVVQYMQSGEVTQTSQHAVQALQADEAESLQMKADVSSTASPAIESKVSNLRGTGSSMPDDTRENMENAFGASFSDVRIHNNTDAQQLNRELNARAFTHKTDIYFNTGEYRPETSEGKHLLAHELAHVQQLTSRATATEQPDIARSPDEDTDELIALGIDPRPFDAIWEEFSQLRRSSQDTEAMALVRTLIVRMTLDDAIDHAGELAFWLIEHDERELARQALDRLEGAWWIRYVSADSEGVPSWIGGGFGTSLGPSDLVNMGEREAAEGFHETARKLLGVAHLMIQMMLAQLYEQQAREEAEIEAAGPASPFAAALSMVRALRQMAFEEITELRTRVLNVYPELVSEARATGDEARTSALISEGEMLTREIGTRYTLADLPDITNLDVQIEPVHRGESQRGGAAIRPPSSPTPAPTSTPVPTEVSAPETPSAPDCVEENSPPFQGRTALALPGNHYVFVRSERYAVSEALSRATAWARNLFGVMSSIVVMHADDDGVIRYYAAALDEDLSESFPTVNPLQAIRVEVSFPIERLRGNYDIMVIHVGNGVGFWPTEGRVTAYENIIAREGRRGTEVTTLGRELVRATVFSPIDDLMENEEENLEEIARRLSQLDSTAFSTISTERRFQYLSVLLRAWTYQAQERAVVELMKSVESRIELNAIIARLRGADRWEALIDDLDHELWSLLITVGERFGTDQLTVRNIYEILADAGLLQVATPIPGLSVGPNGPEFSIDVLAEIEEAANSFLRFVEGIWDAIVMLVTQPDRIIEGLAQLTKMIFVFELARLGYPPAMMMREQILEHFGRQLHNGFKGAGVLGVGRQVLRRIKWAIIWEIATFFVGIGTIRSAMAAMGASARAGAIARFLRLLGLAGRVAEAEQATNALARLARILGRSGRVLRTEEEVLVGLSHLPDDEVARVGRVLEGVDLDASMSLTQLRAAHPELASIAEESLRRAEVIHQLAVKAGGFSDEVARAFARLSGAGHGTDDLARIISNIPDGEGARFLRTLRMIPEDIALAGPRGMATLEVLAQSTSRMQAVERFGFRAVDTLMQRSGRSGSVLDEYLHALERIERELPEASRATAMQELVEGIGRGELDDIARIEAEILLAGGSATAHVADTQRIVAHGRSLGMTPDEIDNVLYNWTHRRSGSVDDVLREMGMRHWQQYQDMSLFELCQRYVENGDETAAAVLRQNHNANDALLRTLRSNWRPPHHATIIHRRGGAELSRETIISGRMNELPDAELALPLPQRMAATHTERWAIRDTNLQPGDFLEIRGQYDPCSNCIGAMRRAAETSGATIRYWWQGGSMTFP